jgi:U5 small nuclear ribonucleoprotein component
VAGFADRLWGDIYFNNDTRKFTRKAADAESPRTFVQFVLEPLYKLYSQVLSEETDGLKNTLAELNIHLKPVMYKMDVRPLLKAVLDQFFGPATGLIDMVVEWIPDPSKGAAAKVSFVVISHSLDPHEVSSQVERTYTGPMSSDVAVSMKECRSDGPVSVHITKLYHATDAQSFRALGRVISGTLKKGEQVKVLGEGYSPEDEEDMMRATVDDLWVSGSRLVLVSRYLWNDVLTAAPVQIFYPSGRGSGRQSRLDWRCRCLHNEDRHSRVNRH